MSRPWIFVNLLLISVLAQFSYTQAKKDHRWYRYARYQPLGEDDDRTTPTGGGGGSGSYVPPGLSCPIPPPAGDIAAAGFEYTSSLLTVSEAASLNVPFFKGSGGQNAMVVVRDYMASLPCTASDAKTVLSYGHTIRTIITIGDYQTKLGTSLPVIAADATLNRKSTKLNIQVKGLTNAKFTGLVANLAGKDFTVETYAEYMSVESQMVRLISDSETKATPTLLGTVDITHFDNFQLTAAPAISWAMTQIVAKRSCDQALSDYSDPGAVLPRSAIVATYRSIAGRCDSTAPDDAHKDIALQFLAGRKTVKR